MTGLLDHMDEVTPEEFKFMLRLAWDANLSVFAEGGIGIAKTEAVKQACAELGRPVVIIHLSVYDVPDLRGFPAPNNTTGKQIFLPPEEFPLEEDSNAVVFFDEINHCHEMLQNAAHKIILDREIAGRKFGKNVRFVAAGNPPSLSVHVTDLSASLANRFIHVRVRPDIDSWLRHAQKNGYHPNVISCLNYNRERLYDYSVFGEQKSFPTPRTWEFVSRLQYAWDEFLNAHDGTASSSQERLFELAVQGAVGVADGNLYVEFSKKTRPLPQASDIISGACAEIKADNDWGKNLASEFRDGRLTLELQYTLMMRIFDALVKWTVLEDRDRRIPDDQTAAYYSNVIRFADRNFDPELCVETVNQGLHIHNLPMGHREKVKNFTAFVKKYNVFLQDGS